MTAEREPLISVVVPTFERPNQLRECLTAMAEFETCGIDFEVIVVNDGGSGNLDGVIGPFRPRLDLKLVSQSRLGPGSARNAGAAVARGAYLAFVDDDCMPARDWLAILVRELRLDDARLLGGRVQNALVDNVYSEASEWINTFVYEHNRGAGAREPFFMADNIALSAPLFREMGGFTTVVPAAEDKEFCDRWRAKGWRLAHVPDAVVYHAHHLTFGRFWRQHYGYGRGSLAFRLRRPQRDEHRMLPETVRFYTRLVLSPLTAGRRRRVRLTALLVVSQLATLAGAAREALQWMLVRPLASSFVSAPNKPRRDSRDTQV